MIADRQWEGTLVVTLLFSLSLFNRRPTKSLSSIFDNRPLTSTVEPLTSTAEPLTSTV